MVVEVSFVRRVDVECGLISSGRCDKLMIMFRQGAVHMVSLWETVTWLGSPVDNTHTASLVEVSKNTFDGGKMTISWLR